MPAKTIDEVISDLEHIIQESKNENSPSGYFPALYKKVTETIRDKIKDKYFDDNKRMEELDVVFANRYLIAFGAYQKHGKCSKSWDLAFKNHKIKRLIVLQHLLLGMNAHISLDLGIAAATVCPGKKIHSLENDFKKINEILASLVDDVQNELSRIWPLLKIIDWIAGKLDEGLADYSMEIARDAAWEVALHASQLNEKERTAYIHQVDERTQRFGKQIANPGRVLRFLLLFIRLTEIGTVKRKIRILNS